MSAASKIYRKKELKIQKILEKIQFFFVKFGDKLTSTCCLVLAFDE